MKPHFFKLLLSLIVVLSVSPLFAQQPSIIDQMIRIKPSLVEVISINAGLLETPKARKLFKDPATGRIVSLQKGTQVASYERQGAGVIIHSTGIIVTNAHVVNQAQQVQVLFANGEKANAKIVKFTTDLDLALLKVNLPAPLPAVVIADSSLIKLNQEIFTVGSSPLLKESISGGKITGLASSRNATYSNSYESDFFKTSMDIYRGDSGGPLFNRSGELVGIMAAKLLSKGHSSFAVSSNKIRRYLIAYLRETQNQK